MNETNKALGMVLYTDGGCRPNPGYGGWGIHGYMFELSKSPKGIGHTTHTATAWGYENKTESKDRKNLEKLSTQMLNDLSKEQIEKFNEQVKSRNSPVDIDEHLKKNKNEQVKDIVKCIHRRDRVNATYFIDSFGTIEGCNTTNNSAEIIAMTKAINLAIEHNVDVLVIRSDSQLVINGITSWINGWIDNNWMTKSQKPVENKDLWQELNMVKDLYELTGGHLHIEWVRGHGDDIGNISADWLATVAVFAAQKKKQITQTNLTPASSEYWSSSSSQCHPMLNHKYMYFVADGVKQGVKTYYIGNQGKEVDLIAKKTSEAGYAVVQIDEGVECVDFVIEHQHGLNNELISMYLIDLDALYGPGFKYTNLYREDFLYKPLDHRYDVRSVDGSPIIRELRPPVIAMRAIDAMIKYSMVLDDYLNKKGTNPISTDITSLFYETIIHPQTAKKPQRIETKFSSEHPTGLSHVKAMVNVRGVKEPIEITLTCGIDIPDRNKLKRLENLNPKVNVITWGADALSFQYATVIEADGCRGIWVGPFSNVRVLEKPRDLTK